MYVCHTIVFNEISAVTAGSLWFHLPLSGLLQQNVSVVLVVADLQSWKYMWGYQKYTLSQKPHIADDS